MLYHGDVLNCKNTDMGPVVGLPTLSMRNVGPERLLLAGHTVSGVGA